MTNLHTSDLHTSDSDTAREEWEQVLWSYSAALDEQRANLAALDAGVHSDLGPVLPIAFEPPADMPPLPAALAPWARQLLEQTGGLTRLAADLAARTEPVRPVVAPRIATRRPAALDTLL